MKWRWRWIGGWSALLAIRNWGIAWLTLSQLDRYRELETAGSPIIRAGVAAVFGLAFTLLLWGVWRRATWVRRRFLVIGLLYGVFDLLWYSRYVQSDYDRGRLPFVLVTFMGIAGFTYWAIYLSWRNT